MSEPLYLLDTGVLLTLVRGQALGRSIDQRFGLRAAKQRPLVCIVTHGEIWVLARRNNWGPQKCTVLRTMLDDLVTVDISHSAVIEAYVELDQLSRAHPDGARNMGKNDLWIAAAAKATGAMLLTLDQDFAHLIPNHVAGIIIDSQPGASEPSA